MARSLAVSLFAVVLVDLLVLVGPAVALSGCEVESAGDGERRRDPVGEASDAVIGGTADLADSAVVGIYRNEIILCTGTLVTPKVIVTAAHCVIPQSLSGHDITEVEVHIGADVFHPDQTYAIAEAAAHPSFKTTTMSLVANHDIGLIRLTEPASIPPIPLVSHEVAKAALVDGAPLRVVGFGITSAGGMDYGGKREAQTTLGNLADDFITLGSGVMCEGDSGGPYLASANGVEYVVGTHSSGNCATHNQGSRIDDVIDDFIAPFVAADCMADDVCEAFCAPLGIADPDCACAADGECDTTCDAGADPDCQAAPPPLEDPEPDPEESGCSVSSPTQGGSPARASSSALSVGGLALSLVAFGALRTRRRARSRGRGTAAR